MEMRFRTKLRVNPVKSERNDQGGGDFGDTDGSEVEFEAENGLKTIGLAFLVKEEYEVGLKQLNWPMCGPKYPMMC